MGGIKTNRRRRESRKRHKRGGSKTHCRRRKCRGGSTTEQIGAAAQMRHYLPFPLHGFELHNELNAIVHHEHHNPYYDPMFKYNPSAQQIINQAYGLINETPETSFIIANQMRIAKEKAERSGMSAAPAPAPAPVQSGVKKPPQNPYWWSSMQDQIAADRAQRAQRAQLAQRADA